MQPHYNHLLVQRLFLLIPFDFSTFTVVLSANREFCLFSFHIKFTSFFGATILARTSSIMLKSSGERGHLIRSGGRGRPCLVPDISGKVYVSHNWTWWETWCVLLFVLDDFYPVEEVLLYSLLLSSFVTDSVKFLFYIYWYYHVIFLLSLLIWCILLIDFQVLNKCCIPRMNLIWFMLYNSFYTL